MARTPEKNFLRAWREHRRLTQAKLAEAVGTTGAVISLLESGERGLSDRWLRKLAPVLGTRPGHLLDVDPHEVDTDVLEIWANTPEAKRPQLLAVMNTFREDIPAPPSIEPEKPLRKPRAVNLKSVRRDTEAAPSEPAEKPKARRGGKAPKRI